VLRNEEKELKNKEILQRADVLLNGLCLRCNCVWLFYLVPERTFLSSLGRSSVKMREPQNTSCFEGWTLERGKFALATTGSRLCYSFAACAPSGSHPLAFNINERSLGKFSTHKP